MIPRSAIVFILCACCLSCFRPSQFTGNVPTAEKIRADALALAKKQNKVVLLVFGAQDVLWCDLLDRYHADADVSRVLSRHFVIAKVDVYETPGGEQMYLEHAPRNVPGFAILDSNGMYLADSGEGDQNVGFPNNPEQVDQYITALKLACPRLSDEDVSVLREKLESLRTAREPDTAAHP